LASDTTTPVKPLASKRLAGVSRISVNNIATNNVQFIYRSQADLTPVREFELCFKCHSSWTTQPSGQSNLAFDFNTRNASYHPVEAQGRNLNINANAFVNGWIATTLTYCTDCHTSDDPTVRGPHASTNRYILKKPYTASSSSRTMSSGESCFDCHRYDTYANNSASSTIRNYSRFAGGNGHTYHVGSRRYPCYACHDSHGTPGKPHLIVLGRSPGITTYTETTGGGSCRPTCHGTESYSVTYAR
jgi:nitrate reductase cytochrome c-type subunit